MTIQKQEFKEIAVSDYRGLKSYFKNQGHKICVFSLSSIIVWSNDSYQPHGAADGDSLIVGLKYRPPNQKESHLFLPISPTRVHSPEELLEIALSLGFEAYWYVTDDYIEQFGRDRVESSFIVQEQPGLDDYVYLKEDLAELRGNRYSKKRNLISQFRKTHLAADRVEVGRIKPSDAPDCIEFLEEWCEERACKTGPSNDLSCEKQAAINALENIDVLGMNGLMLRIDGKTSAFGIASHLTKDMGVFHFQKALASVKGLYQYFDKMCAKLLFKEYKYINKESDMDIPGIAQAKKSYHPVMMIRSYKLRVKS